jgi:integrase/recombinase XerD
MTSVNICKRVKLDKGWRFCALTEDAKKVIVDGQKLALDGRYYLDFLQDGKRVRVPAGATAAEALSRAEQQEKLLAAQRAAAEAGIALPAQVETAVTAKTTGRPLRAAVDKYLAEVKEQKKVATYGAYRNALLAFLKSCSKQMLEEVTREDMLAFRSYLKRRGHSDRTVHNQWGHVIIFLTHCGIDAKHDLALKKSDRPQYTREEPEIYTDEQLDTFFAACKSDEHLLFTFFLETGMRDQEVMHSDWSWVDFERNVISVRENKRFNWKPKANKGRQIAVPSSLIASLKQWKTKCDPTCGLIFPNTKCTPNNDFYTVCQNVVARTGLNPREFCLHKFRATRITNWLRDGIDLKSVQMMAGHADLQSTSRYLATERIDKLQVAVEKAAAKKNGGK